MPSVSKMCDISVGRSNYNDGDNDEDNDDGGDVYDEVDNNLRSTQFGYIYFGFLLNI